MQVRPKLRAAAHPLLNPSSLSASWGFRAFRPRRSAAELSNMATSPETSRRDSFVFVRLALAVAVIFGHSFPLAPFGAEPIAALCHNQLSPEGLAVKGFFILSGYLLMQSFRKQPSVLRFAVRRLFRIMPAFWVCLLVTSFIVVPMMIETMFPGQLSYWNRLVGSGQRNAFSYVANNAALYITQWKVAPVFMHNRFPGILNGSLWSLSYEAICYAGLALAAGLSFLRWRFVPLAGFASLYAPSVIYAFHPFPDLNDNSDWRIIVNNGFHPGGQGVMLAFMAGVAMNAVTAGKFTWNAKYFALAAAAFGASLLTAGFALVWPLTLPYLLLSLCYKLPFHSFGRLGDFSYGTYLYAFLIQQCLYAFRVHESGFVAFFGLAVLLSLACGVLSWMLVERPAMAVGTHLIRLFRPDAGPRSDALPCPIEVLEPTNAGLVIRNMGVTGG